MQEYKIEVQKRDLSNKKSYIKELRKAGLIPGVYYSHDSKSSIPFSIDQKILITALKAESQVYKISVGGKNRDVIIKKIQYHPVLDTILHIDLYGVRMDQAVTVKVPIVFIGQAIGIKEGGVLNQNYTELEVSCLPGDIPQNIEIDISNLSLGEAIRLEDVSTNEQIQLIGESDLLIASVVQPTKVEETESEEALDDDAESLDSTDETSDVETSENTEEAGE
tara:strand:+ start:308 stop:973 length:666 start_codon:yes stop_codon:yes gene_type:complete